MRMHAIGLTSLALMLGACGGNETIESNNISPAMDGDTATLADSFNGDRVTLDGRVVSAGPNTFLLDHGAGQIRVEMDDWDAFREGRLVNAGDRVVVSGRIDGRFLAARTIEARSVYIPGLGTTFYASGADEEDFGIFAPVVDAEPASLNYSGWVVGTSADGFELGSSSTRIRVDTSKLSYNPMDDEGYQKIETGERVYVWGNFRFGESGPAQLVAEGVVSLTPGMGDSGDNSQAGGNTSAAETVRNEAAAPGNSS